MRQSAGPSAGRFVTIPPASATSRARHRSFSRCWARQILVSPDRKAVDRVDCKWQRNRRARSFRTGEPSGGPFPHVESGPRTTSWKPQVRTPNAGTLLGSGEMVRTSGLPRREPLPEIRESKHPVPRKPGTRKHHQPNQLSRLQKDQLVPGQLPESGREESFQETFRANNHIAVRACGEPYHYPNPQSCRNEDVDDRDH